MSLRLLGSLALSAPFAFSSACEGGCSDVSSPDGAGGAGVSGGAGGSGGYVAPPAPNIDWVACPEQSLDAMQCADVPAPLDWNDPNGRSITVFVRHLAATAPVRGSLWLLAGDHGFTALRVAKKPGDDSGPIAAAALRMTFKTDRPLFSYREPPPPQGGAASITKARLLRIYFLANGRYAGEVTKYSPGPALSRGQTSSAPTA